RGEKQVPRLRARPTPLCEVGKDCGLSARDDNAKGTSWRLAGASLRAIFALVAVEACVLMVGCGSSNSNPPPPPPPPSALGHAYITTGSSLFGYAISASNGGLSPIATPTGAPGGSAAVANARKSLLYTLTPAGQISGYSVGTSTGALTAVSGSPFGGAGVGV